MAPFTNPLPADDDSVWKDCSLGPSEKWPQQLQALTLSIASFEYPSALFWGEELLLLHNEAWKQSCGKSDQGQKQRGRLSADAWEGLSTALHGGKPRKVDSRQLLQDDSQGQERHDVLVSPVFDAHDSDHVLGLFVQLVPKRSGPDGDQGRTEEAGDSGEPNELDVSELGTASADKIPLDEHPFFHRFAEMLPTGLAILDHKAHAIFVNQHFYQLTTHESDDKGFKSWPQSIHPDDYDRVMTAYQDAFSSGDQLRTEFRAQGATHPWRLLLLTPLGDENLRHISLRDYGGFICCIVDITSEKSAEFSERSAAQEARDRKEQQERFIDMISHEIRNPLSAILHCTEDIEEAVKDEHGKIDVAAISEAVETINLCIAHQKNIVDDVLSFSKLDASMLSLAPKPYEPARQLANTLKMFEPEFRKQGINFDYCIDTSMVDCGVSWVIADLSRIGQVLINLVLCQSTYMMLKY